MPLELEFDWCAPVSGDGHQLGLATWERPPTLDYAVSVFEAAARGGFRYLLIGMGFNNHVLEAWTLATAVLARTRDVGAIVAVRPGFFSAAQTAKMAATLDTISDGRLALNIVSGGRPREQAKYGDRLDHDARYRRTAEFMDICRRLWTATESFDYRGDYYELTQTRLDALPLTPGGPPFYFGGASGAAETVGADHADVHLFWGETLAQTRERLRRMAFLIAQVGRAGQVRFGVRINVIARPTNAEARAAADFLIAPIDPERVRKAKQRDLDKVLRDSVGQKRQWELLARTDDGLYVEPLLWAGISVARSGAGMTIVGSYDEVAGRLFEYVQLGVSVFILSGYPHLEECERVAEHVIPRVRALAARVDARGLTGASPSGERSGFPPAR